MKPILLSLLFFIALCNLRFKDQEQLEQHHEHISTNQQPLIIHVIPHSHDDVGWLKTVEQYFYGLRNDIQWANVEYIIDSYIEQLQKDPNRKFIQVEIKFFKMWWDKQTIETQNIVKELVNSRQLQFISGGWCMNDEATTYYEDIIDQMTIGHKFLLETFNVIPNIGWQIDPFGHQNSQASLSYQMGFNAWFFARIDYEDKEQRLETQNMETIMIPPAVGVQYPIFTHVQYYHYEAPSGFNFDANRDTDTIVDDYNSKSFNLIDKANKLVQYFRAQSTHYKGNHLIHTFGSDFQWSNAKIFYQNLDKLINYINTHQYNVTLRYSTPEEYIEEINKQNLSYSTKQDDFFPYSDRKNAFWTGYFTSRIAIKGYVKRLGRQAQTYRKFMALMYQQKLVYMSFYNITNAIYQLDDALAICQHHDAVTGTEQQHVNDDYIELLSFGEYQISQETQKILSDLIYGNYYFKFEQCEYNQTADSCKNTYQAFKQNKTVTVTLIDGKVKQQNQTEIIRIKVPNLKYLIKDSLNNIIYGDVDCTSGFQDCDLFFKYQIPQNNVVQYFTIQPVLFNESASEIKMNVNPFPYTEDTLIQLNSTKQFKLKYAYYKAYQGRDQPEGAYIFRIENKTAKNTYGNVVYISIGYGRIMSIFRIVRTNTKTVIKNFYHDIDTFDIQTFVDSISVDDDIGKDIIMLIEIPNFNNNNTFYTDSNGLQFQERILNYRPQYNWSLHEPITGNYYPINGAIYIKDNNESVALLNDRSQGGSSLQNGQIEIMIHRRLLLDDYRGVGEALDETDDKGNGLTQYIQHKLTFFNNQNNPNKIRKLQYFQDQYPLVFLDSYGIKPNIPENLDWFLPFKGLKIEPLLQYGDNLLKFNYLIWNKDELLLRIQNLQESYSMKIDKLEYDGQMIRKTLTGNQNWSDWKQNSLKWNYVKPINNVDEDYDDIFLLLFISYAQAFFFGMTNRIGRQKILVYLMPHSHDDVGWLNTVDEIYLYGPGVRNIISSYIEQLQQNPDRKFVQVETVYFERWWYEQSLTTQTKVKELVKNGQLGFAGGGLVMNDEATPYYEDIIDQMTYGHEFLYNTFGIIPTIGWQIDPFGHSNAQSVLSYLFGMDAQYFARIDYQDKQNREQHQELEMIHIPKTNDEQNRKIFIHVNYQHYSSPPQMDFDTLRNNGGYVNDQNVERKANDLQNYFLKQAKAYKGDIIAHTLGDDNEWSQAKSYFENTEKIINYINSHPDKYNITIKFGTPEDYIKAINEYADEIFYPVKTDDFFPYADKQHCYWTGYFTSKIAFKGFIRYTGRQFQQMKSFISYELAKKDNQILDLKQSLLTGIKDLGYALGVSQHHDAVTGTSKEAVTKDYVRILYKNLTQMNHEFHKLVKLVVKRDIKQDNIDEIYQYSYNATSQQCKEVYESLNKNKTVLLMLLDTKINTDEIDVIKVKVPNLTLNVIDSSNQYINGDVICSNQRDENDCTLYFNFKVKKGIQYFKIQQSDPTNSSTTIIKEQIFTNITATTKISLDDGPEFELQYKYYVASTNNIQPSGAYIFRPEGGSTTYGQIQSAKVYNGSIVTELNIQRNNIDTWIRKYKISDSEYEIETFLDSIAKEQNKGKEVLIIFKSDQIKNDKIFYTDSNGMDLQQRKLGYRETWNLQSNEQIAENYYPVNGLIQIKDMQTNLTMAVVNDRAQGGSSFSDGEIELMIHRRMYLDDRRGVGESLNEEEDNPSCTDPQRQNCLRRIGLKQQVIHKLLFFSPNTHPNAARKSQLFLDFYPLKLFAVDDEAKFKYNQVASTIETLLDQIKITNTQDTAITKLFFIPREKQNEFLVRIQNMQEVGTINISFPDNILYEETILSGLRSWAEQQKIRLKWKKNEENDKQVGFIQDDQIGPQQIKTFMIKI